ncbi:imidazolonepropionase [Hyphomicrobium sp. MC1]|uniref:Imidazolonepropionase n=1 Tax=Escherichia coli TaxID=562 RepID=A0A0U2XD52_ECOLX|nr:imidazolonepropionase [Hyphomicrobium sp. MC1]ALS39169.1 HutI [Escherichia coli]CCB65490.1 putative imidazolonepropionase HutI [Hyphomicrobium sp. MC1]
MLKEAMPEGPRVIIDATFSTMREREADDTGYGFLRDGAAVVGEGKIIWLGSKDELPSNLRHLPTWSAGGRLITPGLVECHTHLIFSGDRRTEFAELASGRNYSDLVWEGHGIFATVEATRAASEDELYSSALRRLRWFVSGGVTTIETKSGYGLDVDNELKMLRVARRLDEAGLARVKATLLAGHVYPSQIEPEDFIELICSELIPQAHAGKLCDFVEAYCEETIGFSLDDASTLLEAAYKRKIPTRISADHLSDSAGAALAPAFYAKAAAHLNYTDDVAIEALASARTTAILLPIAHLELGAKQRPPVDKLREAGVPIAISTGCNPGTAPTTNLLTAAHLSCALFGLSPLEAIQGITVGAAKALGLSGVVGELTPGANADFAIWDAEHPEDLIYWMGAPLCCSTWLSGSPVREFDSTQIPPINSVFLPTQEPITS